MIVTTFVVLVVAVVAAAIVRGLIARKHGYKERFHNARLAYVLIMLATIVGYYDARDLSELRARRDWPTVSGEIIKSQVTGHKAIVPSVTYRYAVGDSAFTGVSDLGTPGFGNSAKRLNEAQTLIADYPVGKTLPVHYDSAIPSRSYLTSAVPWNAYMRYGLWIFTLFAGLATQHFFGFRRR